MKSAGAFLLIIIFSILSQLSLVRAESSWDLGYTRPEPEVEAIPDSITDPASTDERITEAEIQAQAEAAKPVAKTEEPVFAPKSSSAASKSARMSNVSTSKNTFGVETVEKPAIKFYLSPMAGISSIMGNSTVDVLPLYSVGGRVGVLLSDNMMIEGGYTYSLMNTSNPRINTTLGTTYTPTDIFALKQSIVSADAKLFILGREYKLRPFIGGGLAWANSTLNYTASAASTFGGLSQYAADFKMNQFQGSGLIGAEFAFTRALVATVAFRLNGILSTSNSLKDSDAASKYDPNKSQVGNSLSRSTSYAAMAGLGVYF